MCKEGRHKPPLVTYLPALPGAWEGRSTSHLGDKPCFHHNTPGTGSDYLLVFRFVVGLVFFLLFFFEKIITFGSDPSTPCVVNTNEHEIASLQPA